MMNLFRLAGLVSGLLGAASAPGQSPPARPCVASFENGRLTISLDHCLLANILADLSTRTRVALIAADQIGSDAATAAFKDKPLEEGLRTLLAGYDMFFFYGATKDAPSALRTVWIYPRGSGAALRPVPPELWANTKDLEVALSDSDASTRERAYAALMTRPDRQSRELVLHAILGDTEKDEALRQRLLQSAATRGFNIEPGILEHLARADPSAQIRWLALDGLPAGARTASTAQAALSDPDSAVREKAQQILDQLDHQPK